MTDGDVALLSVVCAQVDGDFRPSRIGSFFFLQNGGEVRDVVARGGETHFVLVLGIVVGGTHDPELQRGLGGHCDLRRDKPVVGMNISIAIGYGGIITAVGIQVSTIVVRVFNAPYK